MFAKATGILLLIAGAVVICMGVAGMTGVFEGGQLSLSGVALRLVAGMFLLTGGGVITAIAFHSHMTRGLTGIFRRLQGARIDEEIARLAKLRGDGYITGEEYEAAKKKLLGDI